MAGKLRKINSVAIQRKLRAAPFQKQKQSRIPQNSKSASTTGAVLVTSNILCGVSGAILNPQSVFSQQEWDEDGGVDNSQFGGPNSSNTASRRPASNHLEDSSGSDDDGIVLSAVLSVKRTPDEPQEGNSDIGSTPQRKAKRKNKVSFSHACSHEKKSVQHGSERLKDRKELITEAQPQHSHVLECPCDQQQNTCPYQHSCCYEIPQQPQPKSNPNQLVVNVNQNAPPPVVPRPPVIRIVNKTRVVQPQATRIVVRKRVLPAPRVIRTQNTRPNVRLVVQSGGQQGTRVQYSHSPQRAIIATSNANYQEVPMNAPPAVISSHVQVKTNIQQSPPEYQYYRPQIVANQQPQKIEVVIGANGRPTQQQFAQGQVMYPVVVRRPRIGGQWYPQGRLDSDLDESEDITYEPSGEARFSSFDDGCQDIYIERSRSGQHSRGRARYSSFEEDSNESNVYGNSSSDYTAGNSSSFGSQSYTSS